MNKARLRREFLTRRIAMSAEENAQKSDTICRRLIRHRIFISASTVGLYWPIRNEVATKLIFTAALSANKRVGLPRVITGTDRIIYYSVSEESVLETSAYGILEPPFNPEGEIPSDAMDLIVVPGIVFDSRGYRIGYGGGFFDRLLAEEGIIPHTAATAFDFQVIPKIPEEQHDRRVAMIVTEHRTLTCT